MRTRILSIILLSISLFAVKLGTPAEDVFIRGVNTGVNVDPSSSPEAIFEVFSDDDGILIPRLTIAQRDAILAPPEGLMIYNTDCHLFNYYDGATWLPFPNLSSLGLGTITGNTTVCEGSTGEPYSVAAVDDAISYTWSLPDGATIATGTGTRSITVDFGTMAGVLCVTANTLCSSQSVCMDIAMTPPSVGGSVTGGATITIGSPTPTMTLSGYTGSIVRWERRIDGGSWAPITHIAATYSETPATPGTYEYRTAVQNGTCPVAYSTATTCIVEPLPTEGDSVVFSYTGSIVSWAVPTGVYSVEIECWGAQGGTGGGSSYPYGSPGGLGARMRGTFSVIPGTLLKVLVGEQGVDITYYTAGGGGGSFVWQDGASIPMIIAGGGGGGGGRGVDYYDGIDAVVTENGTDGNNAPGGAGTSGNGGVAVPDGSSGYGAGGCGWYSNGAAGYASGYTYAEGGTRPLSGGAGGAPGGSTSYNTRGGFGGGGGAQGIPNTAGGGGGGGYSGGGGGKRKTIDGGYQYSGGGGGGSFNSGTSQSNSPGVRSGNGRVVIRY